MDSKHKSIINKYKLACNEVLHAFCERHEMYADDDPWVGGKAGGIACIGDYFVDMQTILYDIEYEPDTKELLRWMDYRSRLMFIGIEKDINYESWCKGAPRLSEESLSRLEEMKKQIDRTIDEYKQKVKDTLNDF